MEFTLASDNLKATVTGTSSNDNEHNTSNEDQTTTTSIEDTSFDEEEHQIAILHEIRLELEILHEKSQRGLDVDLELIASLRKEYSEILATTRNPNCPSNPGLYDSLPFEITMTSNEDIEALTTQKRRTNSIDDINSELDIINEMMSRGIAIDQNRQEYLMNLKLSHPAYIVQQEMELETWRLSIANYCEQSLSTMRSFVPLNIFSATLEDLVNQGIPLEIARRVQQKQCLWFIRMSEEEIVRLHEADLNTRFSIAGQGLDIVEIAAIYACLPLTFPNDLTLKKTAFRSDVESTLKAYLHEEAVGTLSQPRIRASAYQHASAGIGPIEDRSNVRAFQAVKGMRNTAAIPRRSFIEVCSQFSILRNSHLDSSATTSSTSISISTLPTSSSSLVVPAIKSGRKI